MARRGASDVFRKNTPAPHGHPRPRRVDLYFFSTPRRPSLSSSLYLAPMVYAGLANFEMKTPAESKTKLVLRLFAVTKQGKCKTTIKTVARMKNMFHQSSLFVCRIALWKLITESKAWLIISLIA